MGKMKVIKNKNNSSAKSTIIARKEMENLDINAEKNKSVEALVDMKVEALADKKLKNTSRKKGEELADRKFKNISRNKREIIRDRKDKNAGEESGEQSSEGISEREEGKKELEASASGMLPIFSNRVWLRIDGYNQNRLLSTLVKEGVKIYLVQKKSQKLMDIVIDGKFRQKGIASIEKLCYNYRVMGISGIKPFLTFITRRIGLMVGIAIFITLAAISNTFIWKIDIEGNENIDSLTIMRELRAVDVSLGKSKRFDTFEVTKAINSIDGIAECTVEVVGTTVKVSVIESKEYIPPDNDDTICDIVSMYDAEVTRVIVSGGTGKVRIGDRVPAGTILISREVLNTNGELLLETRAKGSVYGKVVFSDTTIISTTTEVVTRTGREHKSSSMSMWGISTKANNNHGYLDYQAVSTSSYVFKNTFLPIVLKQTTFYEVEKRLEERSIDEMIEEYKRDKLLSMVINAGGSEISTTITKQELSQGLYKVYLYMEAEMLISTSKN